MCSVSGRGPGARAACRPAGQRSQGTVPLSLTVAWLQARRVRHASLSAGPSAPSLPCTPAHAAARRCRCPAPARPRRPPAPAPGSCQPPRRPRPACPPRAMPARMMGGQGSRPAINGDGASCPLWGSRLITHRLMLHTPHSHHQLMHATTAHLLHKGRVATRARGRST